MTSGDNLKLSLFVLDIPVCSQETSGYEFLVLCREAHHLLRWQRVHTSYSKLEEGGGRENTRSDESSRNQRDQVHFTSSGSMSRPVP